MQNEYPWGDEIYLKTKKQYFSGRAYYAFGLGRTGENFLVEALGFSENFPHYLTLFESLGVFGYA